MKLLKKNQVIIYVIAIMIMTAGYLNFTTNTNDNQSIETSMQMEAKDDTLLADIGDATLVNSNDVVTGEETTPTSEDQTKSEKENSNNEGTEQADAKKGEEVKTNSEVTKDDYFVQSKLERDTMYSQMLETYEKVLNSSNSLETQKQTATQEITRINELKNSIMICENLIKTKGFENSIIFVNDKSISVIVESEEMKPEDVAKIQNIISREMKADIDNIHISTK